MMDFRGATAYAYDALDRLTSVTHPGGKIVTYAFDAVDNRKSLTYPDGKAVNYAYDPANRLSQVTDWLARTTTYSYDSASNLTKTAYPNGASIAFSYDAANRLARVVNSTKNLPLLNLAYTLDNVGNRTALSVDGLTTNYAYDQLNELIRAQLGALKSVWTYDEVGNRLSQTLPLMKTNYSYDADDRLLNAGLSTFTYDANGNQISKTQLGSKQPLVYAYDAANRLVSVAGGTSTSSFTYDGDGNRVSQRATAGTYDYLNDVATALPVALQESGPDGNISYAYGLGLVSESGPTFNYYYHYDGLGSVVGLTNDAGRAAAAYAYDTWGNPLLSIPDSVGTKNKFRFTGEALDPGTGLYYLRARYHDTSTGRMNSVDPLFSVLTRNAALLKYAYAANNPINQIDPTGELSWAWVGSQIKAFGTSVVEGIVTDTTQLAAKSAAAAAKAAVNGAAVVTAAATAAAREAGSASNFLKLSVIGSAVGYVNSAVTEYLISNFGQDQLVHITGLELATGLAGGIVGSLVGPEGTAVGAAIGGVIGAGLQDLLIPKLAK